MSQRNILSINVGIGDGQNVQHKSRLNVQGSHCHRDKMLQWTFWLGPNVTVDVVNLDVSSRHPQVQSYLGAVLTRYRPLLVLSYPVTVQPSYNPTLIKCYPGIVLLWYSSNRYSLSLLQLFRLIIPFCLLLLLFFPYFLSINALSIILLCIYFPFCYPSSYSPCLYYPSQWSFSLLSSPCQPTPLSALAHNKMNLYLWWFFTGDFFEHCT